MCYSGYKGTIKRAKKQMKFDFSEPTNETRAEYARMLCLVRRRKTAVSDERTLRLSESRVKLA